MYVINEIVLSFTRSIDFFIFFFIERGSPFSPDPKVLVEIVITTIKHISILRVFKKGHIKIL